MHHNQASGVSIRACLKLQDAFIHCQLWYNSEVQQCCMPATYCKRTWCYNGLYEIYSWLRVPLPDTPCNVLMVSYERSPFLGSIEGLVVRWWMAVVSYKSLLTGSSYHLGENKEVEGGSPAACKRVKGWADCCNHWQPLLPPWPQLLE